MNSVVRIGLLVMVAVLPVSTTRDMLATAASTLFESTPFILAGLALAAPFRGARGVVALLGCGCGAGPSARSLPAALATGIVFGPAIAVARFATAWFVSLVPERRRLALTPCENRACALGELRSLLPAAAGAAVAMHAMTAINVRSFAPAVQTMTGAALAFAASPCALGAVALGSALHARSALAAVGFLAIAGILDARALVKTRAPHPARHNPIPHDALAYVTASLALAIVAVRHGDALVHPAFAIPLGISAAACAIAALRFRSCENRRQRIAPAIMLAGALLGAPAPEYHATETTMTDLFAGERLTFTGALVREGSHEAIVRYAITCCRADAAPIVLGLAHPIAYATGTWLQIDGRVVRDGDALHLAPERVVHVPAPSDPFVYR